MRRTDRPRAGRRARAAAAAGVAALCLTTALSGCSAVGAGCGTDALTARSLAELGVFSTWLRTHGVQGTVGEVGWPHGLDADRWNTLGDHWFDTADDDQMGVLAWSAAQRWPADYPMGIYRDAPAGSPGFLADKQAPVVEGHLSAGTAASAVRGISLADATFGASVDDTGTYSSTARGVPGTAYTYPSEAFLRFLAGRGVKQVRLSVMWERLQPVLGAPLDPAELGRLRAALAAAQSAGLSVGLDLHNYGRYAQGTARGGRRVLLLGSPQLPASRLADLWTRLATELRGGRTVVAYGIMNEPHDLPGGAPGWEASSRAAVQAVRAVDTTTPVYVGGYAYSGAGTWAQNHPAPWIDSTLWPVVYEAHQYFDTSREGVYSEGYAATLAAAQAQGWAPCAKAPAPGRA